MMCVHRSRTLQSNFQNQFAPIRQTYKNQKTTFEYIKLLGQGSFAKVLLVKDLANDKLYALKIVNFKFLQHPKKKIEKSEMIFYSAEENIKEEIIIHHQLQHPNIVSLYDIFEDEKNIYLVLEYCDGGNLYQWLERIGKFSEQSTANIVNQIIQALLHLQSKYVIHRDIKPENILLTNEGVIKLCDFGWAQQSKTLIKLNVIAGTTEFMPPEILFCQPHSFQVDIWSLGVLLYEMLHGDLPFRGKNIEEICNKIKNVSYQISNLISDEARSLIIMMLQFNQNIRPTLTEIQKHSFLQKFQKKNQPFQYSIQNGTKNNNGVSPSYQNQNNDPQGEHKQQQIQYLQNTFQSEILSPFPKNKPQLQFQTQQFYTVAQQTTTNQQPLTPYPFNNQQLLKQSMIPPVLQASLSSNSTASSQQNTSSLKQTMEPVENSQFFNSLPTQLNNQQTISQLQTTSLPNNSQLNYTQKQIISQSTHILKTQVNQFSNNSQIVSNFTQQSLKLSDSTMRRTPQTTQQTQNQQIIMLNQSALKPQFQHNANSPPTQKSSQMAQTSIFQISSPALPVKRQYSIQQQIPINRFVSQLQR